MTTTFIKTHVHDSFAQDGICFIPDRPVAQTHECALSMEEKQGHVPQLARLASQHQSSEYNRLKFGPNGSPVIYVPFSIQMPDRVRQLQEHQALCAEQKTWWPCTRKSTISIMETASDLVGSHPPLSRPSSETDMRIELSAAMSESLPPPPPPVATAPAPQMLVKTSVTHPISVSPMIPIELLGIISTHLCAMDSRSSPVVFDLPSTFYLDRVSALPASTVLATTPRLSEVVSAPTRPTALIRSLTPPASRPDSIHALGFANPAKLAQLIWATPTLKHALVAAAHTHAHAYPKLLRPSISVTSDIPVPSFVKPTLILHDNDHVESQPETKSRRSISAPSLVDVALGPPTGSLGVTDMNFDSLTESGGISLTRPTHSDVGHDATHDPQPFSSPPPLRPTIGNLFLSSCPGKKVRLNGPVRGRCGVCRDLRMDLQRIRDLGVACIVCCLDDQELEGLGVTWHDYSQIADELGIDVLRIPTPEGLAPVGLHRFDAQLTALIKNYTLRGTPILAHCRGGVGRAGLVACCWILKLGLCGWIETAPTLAFTAPEDLLECMQPDAEWGDGSDSPHDDPNGVRRDTMQLVERVISVVRRRRSPKAVETYEQVRFLVDFVELLRARSNAGIVACLASTWETQVD